MVLLEPRICGPKVAKVIKALNFDKSIIVEVSGSLVVFGVCGIATNLRWFLACFINNLFI